MSGPGPTELSQPGIHLPKWFGLQPVETALCVHRGFHETGVPQHSQVLGDGRLRHPKLTLDLSNRLLGRDQQAQYRAAVRLRNDFEHGFHFLCILHSAYTCQGIFRQAAQATVAEVDFDSLKSALRYFREAAPKHTIEDDVVFSIAGRDTLGSRQSHIAAEMLTRRKVICEVAQRDCRSSFGKALGIGLW